MESDGRKGGIEMKRLLLIAALALCACFEDRLSGGTDEVENPALTVVLRDGAGSPTSGTLRIYARFQNPSRDSVPVLSAPAAGASGLEVRAKSLVSAMEAAASRGIPWRNRDSVSFNIVGSTSSDEAFAGDYLLRKDGGGTWTFRRVKPPEGTGPYAGPSLSTRLDLAAAVLGYKGTVGDKGLALGLKTLFIPGSPYHAAVGSDGAFTLPRLAPGRYDVKALDAEGKAYGALDSLDTDAAFAPVDWSEADLIWVGD
jgi:hypothetical protein